MQARGNEHDERGGLDRSRGLEDPHRRDELEEQDIDPEESQEEQELFHLFSQSTEAFPVNIPERPKCSFEREGW